LYGDRNGFVVYTAEVEPQNPSGDVHATLVILEQVQASFVRPEESCVTAIETIWSIFFKKSFV
jgi:hypothetical protein